MRDDDVDAKGFNRVEDRGVSGKVVIVVLMVVLLYHRMFLF